MTERSLYAFRVATCSAAPEVIGEMEETGWALDSWAPCGAEVDLGAPKGMTHRPRVMLAFTREEEVAGT